jgi:hypothetical protein
MKSDEVFLKGVYEKAKELQKDEGNKERKSTSSKRVFTKYMSVAAVFVLVVSIGVYQKLIKQENQSVKPQTNGLESRNTRSLNVTLSLSEAATDILEVKAVTKNGITAYEIVTSYKGDREESVLNQIIITDNIFEKLSSGQTAVYFLQADTKEILSIFYSSEKEPDVFINQIGESMTKDDLEDIKENNGNKIQRK